MHYCIQHYLFKTRKYFELIKLMKIDEIDEITLSIFIEHRSKPPHRFSSITNINRLIDIDCHRLSSIDIGYRFYRLDTPGIYNTDEHIIWL